jgi:hypothetical protein
MAISERAFSSCALAFRRFKMEDPVGHSARERLAGAGFAHADTRMLISVFESVSAAYGDTRVDDVIVDALCTMAGAGSRAPEKLAAYADHRARYARRTLLEALDDDSKRFSKSNTLI